LRERASSEPQKEAALFSLNRFYTGKTVHFLPEENDCSLD